MAQDPVKRKEHLQQYYEECRSFANAMTDSGPFFLGDRFRMADVVLTPFWQRMNWVGEHYIQLEFPDDKEFDRLRQWLQATSSRPSVAATLVCKPRLIASYSNYATNVATSDFAKNIRS